METSAEAAAVIRSTVDLGRSLDLAVVAEGVESEPQRRALWELGCAAGQGHLFARPMAAPPPARRAAPRLRRPARHARAAAARGGLGHPLLAARPAAGQRAATGRLPHLHRVIACETAARTGRAPAGSRSTSGSTALSAAFAAITAATSTLLPHRAWGAVAVVGYAAAAVAVAGPAGPPRAASRYAGPARSSSPRLGRDRLAADGDPGRASGPAAAPTARRRRSSSSSTAGERLLDTGTPYLATDAIAALPADERLLGYLPYQPGMSLFGLPRARRRRRLVDGRADLVRARDRRRPRRLGVAAARAGPAPAARRAVRHRAPGLRADPGHRRRRPAGARAVPARARAVRGRRLRRAGLAVGSGRARSSSSPGRSRWCCSSHAADPRAPGALAPASRAGARRRSRVLALVPAVLVDPRALVDNVLALPARPRAGEQPRAVAVPRPPDRDNAARRPGHRRRRCWWPPALAIAVWLLRRPPRTAVRRRAVCGYGLLAAILLMPSTRFGYLLYPVALFALVPALRIPARSRCGCDPADRRRRRRRRCHRRARPLACSPRRGRTPLPGSRGRRW